MTQFQCKEVKAVLCLFKLPVWTLPNSLAKHNLIPFHLYSGKIIFSCVLYMTLNWRSVVLLSIFVMFVDVGSDHIYQIEPLQVWDGASLPVHQLWAWVTSRLLDNFSLFNFNFQCLHTLYWSASFKTIINFIVSYNSCKIGLILLWCLTGLFCSNLHYCNWK